MVYSTIRLQRSWFFTVVGVLKFKGCCFIETTKGTRRGRKNKNLARVSLSLSDYSVSFGEFFQNFAIHVGRRYKR